MKTIAIDLTARAVLFPLLAGQAIYTARRSLKLPEAAGTRTGIAGHGPQPLKLLIVGDSSAAGVGVGHQDQALLGQMLAQLGPDFDLTFTLDAKTGSTTADVLARLDGVEAQPFDAVVVCLGVNDVTSGMQRARWIDQTHQLIALLTDKFSARQICLTGLPPIARFPSLPDPLRWIVGRQAARFDRASARIARSYAHVDRIAFDMTLSAEMMAADGYHPGPEIYHRWAQLCSNRIVNRFCGGELWVSPA